MRLATATEALVSGLAVMVVAASSAWAQEAGKPLAGTTIRILAKASPAGPPEQCFQVKEIVIERSDDLVSREAIEAKVRPLSVSCQGNTSVSAILKELNGLHADAGYVTTQAFLPPQDIGQTKRLTIQVVAGRVGKVKYVEERPTYRWFAPRMAERTTDLVKAGGVIDLLGRVGAWYDALDDEMDRLVLLPPSVRIGMTQTVEEGEVLHVDPLQDTIDSLNRVPSHQAAAELAPGTDPATSDIIIKNRIDDSFRGYVGFDTESVDGVDRRRFGTTLEKDNLLGINDIWSVTLRSGTDVNELAGNVLVPVGNVTWRAAADWQETATDLTGLAELFVTTWNVSGGADWVVQRSKTSRIALDFTLNHRERDRYINGLSLEGESVSALSGGVAYTRSFERASISGRIGATFGLPILNARVDPDDMDEAAPKSQFSKLDLSFNAGYVFPGIASMNTSFVSQLTDDVLYQDDQITIGSRASVRGFSNTSFSADSGFVWRNEVAFALPSQQVIRSKSAGADMMRASLDRLNPYVFIDAGAGRDNANEIDGYRVSSGFGLRYGGPRLSYDVGYGFHVVRDDVTPDDGSDGEAFVNIRMKLF